MATTYLSKNLPANQNSLHKWTYSGWIKRCDLGAETYLFNFYDDDNNRGGLRFNADDTLFYYERVGGSTVVNKTTDRKFIDTAAWYHVMVAVDKSVSSPDTQIYINGVEETSFSTDTDYTQNQSTKINDNDNLYINSYNGSSDIKNQIQTHVHWVSGYKLTPTTFGETDSTSGVWKPKVSPSVTYGTNGFFLKFENSAAMGTDSSGNSNNFTVSGTLTQNVDTPDNNFPTFNVLAPSAAALNFGNGNLYNGDQSPNNWQSLPATMGCSSGKWYWELKDESDWGSTSDSTRRYGIVDLSANLDQSIGSSNSVRFSDATSAYAYMNESGVRHNGSTISGSASTHPTFQEGDFLMVAMDLDNNKLYFGKNGTWNDSGNPASGASGTGSVATLASGVWSPYVETRYGSDNVSINFGQGYFRTAVAGTNADANGHGKFKYSVPSGYYSINTKNIKEFG